VSCDDVRERFSELVDDRLAPADRVEVDAHLDGCATCRHELERFRATVALVRSLAPARAPAGFVDRVTAARRPWWRRAFFPLPVKLPIEVAAILLVGVGVAYLFQRTPELQQATREERPAPPDAPARTVDPTTPSRRDVPAPPPALEPRREAAPQAPASAPATPAPAPEPAERANRAGDVAGARPGLERAAPRAREEASDLTTRGDTRQQAAKSARAADVTATLRVASRPAAEHAVRDLVTRHRGTVDSAGAEADASVIQARIPRDQWAGFAEALAALGGGEPPRTGDLPAEVRVTIRLE
jgi:hypothetical protein